jgi:hypothetical protein
MDYKYIEQLLERYWKCETSLEEEMILRAFFSQKDVPANLLPYKDLFIYEQKEPQADVLGDDFDRKMMSLIGEETHVKARTVKMTQRLMPLFKAAAVVAIFLTLGNAAQVAFNDDTNTGNPTNTAVYGKTHDGPSVAMGDSAKIDSAMQKTTMQPATSLLK